MSCDEACRTRVETRNLNSVATLHGTTALAAQRSAFGNVAYNQQRRQWKTIRKVKGPVPGRHPYRYVIKKLDDVIANSSRTGHSYSRPAPTPAAPVGPVYRGNGPTGRGTRVSVSIHFLPSSRRRLRARRDGSPLASYTAVAARLRLSGLSSARLSRKIRGGH